MRLSRLAARSPALIARMIDQREVLAAAAACAGDMAEGCCWVIAAQCARPAAEREERSPSGRSFWCFNTTGEERGRRMILGAAW